MKNRLGHHFSFKEPLSQKSWNIYILIKSFELSSSFEVSIPNLHVFVYILLPCHIWRTYMAPLRSYPISSEPLQMVKYLTISIGKSHSHVIYKDLNVFLKSIASSWNTRRNRDTVRSIQSLMVPQFHFCQHYKYSI